MTPLRSRLFSSPLEERVRVFAAMPPAWRGTIRGNLSGAVLSAVVTLPMSMGLGALAFSPFGPAFVARGVVAALYSVAFMGLVAMLVGARGVAIYAPRSLVAFMTASVSAGLFLQAAWLPAGPDALEAAILLTLSLAGLFQLCFGLARFAKVVKFIPTPVMAGFQNSAALVVMSSQLPALLGIASPHPAAHWREALSEVRPLSVLVAAATLALVFRGSRVTKRVPALVLGLAGGTAFYQLLAFAGFGALLGPTLGAIPMATPDGHELAAILSLTLAPGFADALPAIVAGALSIAVVSSLDVLINAKIVENLTRQRGNGTQELINVGSANLVAPLLGGISGSISLASTSTAVRGGATNSLALLFHAALFLVLIPVVAPALAHIPRAVIGALVFFAGTQLVDRWSLELAKRVAARKAVQWRGISVDLGVIVVVAGIALSGNIMAAVLVGVTIAVVVFILRMSRGVIRRERHGDAISSRRAREASDGTLLASHGRAILAIELEGPLFFASAELLYNRIDAAPAEGVRYAILDLGRVTELDSTGARILLQADERLGAAKCRLVMCGADSRPELLSLLIDHGVADAFTHERMFRDLDQALEWCENDLLASLRSTVAGGEYPLERVDLLRSMAGPDREALRCALARQEYAAADVVFRQGDEGNALYLIARGSASVWLRDTASAERRLVTFSQGTFFGEMALLDRERRSATVTADEGLVCYVLQRAAFDELARSHPHAAHALLLNMGRELSLRMRRANRTLSELA